MCAHEGLGFSRRRLDEAEVPSLWGESANCWCTLRHHPVVNAHHADVKGGAPDVGHHVHVAQAPLTLFVLPFCKELMASIVVGRDGLDDPLVVGQCTVRAIAGSEDIVERRDDADNEVEHRYERSSPGSEGTSHALLQ